MSTPSRSASAFASAFGRTLKPTTIAFDAAASMMSDATMPPTPEWITWTETSSWWIFAELVHRGLDRALHVGLDDQGELLDGALLHLREEILEADGLAALGEHLGALALGALLGGLAGDAVVLDDAAELAGRRRLVEAEDLDRHTRPGVLDALAVVVVERLHLAPGVAGDDGVADAQRAALHEHRRHRAAADVEARLDDDAARVGARVRLQLEHVGLEQDRVQQLVEVRPGLRRDVLEDRVAAPLRRLQALARRARCARGRGSRRAGRSCSRRRRSGRRRPWRGRSPRSSAA